MTDEQLHAIVTEYLESIPEDGPRERVVEFDLTDGPTAEEPPARGD